MESNKVVISPPHPQFGGYFWMMFCMVATFNALSELVHPMLLPDPVPPLPAFLIITAIASFALSALATWILIFAHLFFQTWFTNFKYTVLKSIGMLSLMLAIYSMGVASTISFSLSSWIFIPLVSLHLVLFIVGCYFLWKRVCCYQLNKHYNDIEFPPIMFLLLVASVSMIVVRFFPPSLRWAKLLVLAASLVYAVVGTFIVLKRFIFPDVKLATSLTC